MMIIMIIIIIMKMMVEMMRMMISNNTDYDDKDEDELFVACKRGTWGRYHEGRRPSGDDNLHSPTVIPPSPAK